MSFDQYPNLVSIRSSVADPLTWRHLENLEKIGKGLFGNVYRAWDALLQREVALKLCRWTDDSTEAWAHFTLQEARLLARIRHPNVVTVYGVDHHEGTLGVWMEYIRGCTLAAFLREHGQLTAREAAPIGVDVCSGVACAHALGYLHRDIKTKNVMREDAGRIVLLDFGLSQDLHNTSSAEAAYQIRGTILYMAPEVMRGEQATVQSDIYGIGVLLYHLVTRCYPAAGRSLNEVRRVHERGEVKSLRDRRTGLPECFLRIVERSLCPEPAGRFTTAGEMAQALSACYSDRSR
jgi:serine/threonine protein kinase